MKKNGVISLGEALIDFIPLDDTNTTYQKSPGGAPANVAVGVSRLGAKSSFLGKVGEDVLGKFMKETLASYGVETSQMSFTKDVRTGAVFVTLAENGERSFDFYIDPSADRFLEAADINEQEFTSHKILHFGSISMISGPSVEATQHAVQLAKDSGMVISYDPNLRLNLWPSEDQARETILSMMGHADVVKISEEELEFLTGEKDIETGVKKLEGYEIPFLLVTLGSEGSYVFTKDGSKKVPAMKVQAVDTTGAGDAFVSGILYGVHQYEGSMREVTSEEAAEMARFAAVSGALAASTKGAMTALPTLEEVQNRLQRS